MGPLKLIFTICMYASLDNHCCHFIIILNECRDILNKQLSIKNTLMHIWLLFSFVFSIKETNLIVSFRQLGMDKLCLL